MVNGLGRRAAALLGAAAVITAMVGANPAQASPATQAVSGGPCSSGLVALTYDDGPGTTDTPRLLDILARRQVRATFFVVGTRASGNADLIQRMLHDHHVVENHSWDHTNFTSLSRHQVRSQIVRTNKLLKQFGASRPTLVRPPYGATNHAIKKVINDLGMVQVLWDFDVRDWENRSAAAIARDVIASVRPNQSNVVLLHDGVGNSDETVDATPRIIAELRDRNYCFTVLGPDGRPADLTPPVQVSAGDSAREGGHSLAVRFQLATPTSHPVRLRVRVVGGTAQQGNDFRLTDARLTIAAGDRRASTHLVVLDDRFDEPVEGVRLRVTGKGGGLVRHRLRVAIADNDPRPGLSTSPRKVRQSNDGPVTVRVPVRLNHLSGRDVTVRVTTVDGSAEAGTDYTDVATRVRIPAGSRRVLVPVVVAAATLDESTAETFAVVLRHSVGAGIAVPRAKVTILPVVTAG